jgi:cell wall-associated NlpC family hydrolase
MVLAAMAVSLMFAVPAQAAQSAAGQSAQARITALDNGALDWAEGRTGYPYIYGGAGPYGFDCSGLVMAAYQHVGISLPHSTYAMLGSPHLHWVPLSQVRRGDLLFYGSGHVEFATIWYHVSFGAHDSGSRIGWIRWWPGSWAPTAAYTVS